MNFVCCIESELNYTFRENAVGLKYWNINLSTRKRMDSMSNGLEVLVYCSGSFLRFDRKSWSVSRHRKTFIDKTLRVHSKNNRTLARSTLCLSCYTFSLSHRNNPFINSEPDSISLCVALFLIFVCCAARTTKFYSFEVRTCCFPCDMNGHSKTTIF